MSTLPSDWSPYRWGLLAAEENSVRPAFQQMQRDLGSIGLENVALLLDVPLNELKFPGQDHVVGTMIHADFPGLCEGTPAVELVRDAARSGAGGLMRPECMGELPDLQALMYDVGFSVGGFCVAVDQNRNSVSFLAASWFDDPKEFDRVFSRCRERIQLGFLYLIEVLSLSRGVCGDYETLSVRERDCLAWVALGHPTKVIADKMHLAESTVNEYLSNACRKLCASNRTQACARAMLAELIKR